MLCIRDYYVQNWLPTILSTCHRLWCVCHSLLHKCSYVIPMVTYRNVGNIIGRLSNYNQRHSSPFMIVVLRNFPKKHRNAELGHNPVIELIGLKHKAIN